MLHLIAANYNWHHTITDKSEEIRVFATIFPMVSTRILTRILRVFHSCADPELTLCPCRTTCFSVSQDAARLPHHSSLIVCKH
jgi:hypothetical protein